MKLFVKIAKGKCGIYLQKRFIVAPEEWACLKENIIIIERLK